MTNYTKSTNFTSKDSLASGNPLKIVKGTEIDAEFNNIVTAIGTKADLLSPTFTGTPVAPTAALGTNTTQLATTAFVLNCLYPVGSIYINASISTNPATLFGFGTWVAFGAGKVAVGINGSDGSFNTLEQTGGSKDTTLPSHTHYHTANATTGTQSSDHSHGATSTSTVSDPGHVHAGGAPAGGQNIGSASPPAITTSGNTSAATTGISVSTSTSIGGASANHTHNVTVSGDTAATGVSPTNTNLQPYVVVAMWKRVS